MHLAAGKARRRLVDEINITPLTDVFLVLLIIMMVVAPMMKLSRHIKPPVVEGGTPITSVKLIVEVAPTGEYFVDGAKVPAEGLSKALTAKAAKFNEKDVILNADGQTRAHAIMELFRAAQEAGYEKMTVSVQELSPKRAAELAAAPEAKPEEAKEPGK